jgi:glycosyltransferase involved in cell wall biosynthesis
MVIEPTPSRMNIFFFCQDFEFPSGGVKKLYRQVDILNENGFSAWLVHEKPGFRSRWFENQTRVVSTSTLPTGVKPDFLVFGETLGPDLTSLCRGPRKVIFNQNAYYTFSHYSLDKVNAQTPYLDREVVAAIVVSEDSKAYLQYVFPELPVFRIHHSIDSSRFIPSAQKRRQIAYMPRKNQTELLQVLNILRFRGRLEGFDLVPIENVSESEVARILAESQIFLSFGYPEGFSLPPAEAMASGCAVIGYDGNGGREFMKTEFSWPVPNGDIIAYVRTVEEVMDLARARPDVLREKTALAADFIRAHYTADQERNDIVNVWRGLQKQFAVA